MPLHFLLSLAGWLLHSSGHVSAAHRGFSGPRQQPASNNIPIISPLGTISFVRTPSQALRVPVLRADITGANKPITFQSAPATSAAANRCGPSTTVSDALPEPPFCHAHSHHGDARRVTAPIGSPSLYNKTASWEQKIPRDCTACPAPDSSILIHIWRIFRSPSGIAGANQTGKSIPMQPSPNPGRYAFLLSLPRIVRELIYPRPCSAVSAEKK